MPHTITPASTWHTTIDALADGDPVAQASNDPFTQQLADNAKYIYDTVGINGSGNLVKTASASNTSPITYTGNGTGAGGVFTGGASGNGLTAAGGASGGAGIVGTANGNNARGGDFTSNGSGNGVRGTGGTTGVGVRGIGGSTSGAGGQFTGTAGNAVGVIGTSNGSGDGGQFVGGTTGVGVRGTGGSTSGTGVVGIGGGGNSKGGDFTGTGSGHAADFTAGTGNCVEANGASGQICYIADTNNGYGFYMDSSGIGLYVNGTTGIATGSQTVAGAYFRANGTPACVVIDNNSSGPPLTIRPSSAPTTNLATGALYVNGSTLMIYNGASWVAV